MSWLRNVYHQICRFFFWGWKMRNSSDWDYHFFLESMLLKLQRMEDYMINYGWSQESENERSELRRSLKLSIALLKRLTTRDNMMYAIHAEKAHEVKWGPVITRYTGNSIYITRYKVNDDNKQQYSKDSKKLMDFSYKIYQRDKRLLFGILDKYLEYLWDQYD